VQLVESLARVLQLDADERTHLFLLALRQHPPVETFSPPTISTTLQQFLDSLGTTPSCAVDVRLNVVAWNAAFWVVFCDYDTVSEQERNLIWRLFSSPLAQRNEEWEEIARVYVAQFRAGYGRFIHDPWWTEQIAELNRSSPEFRELWLRQDVLNVSEGRKTMHHPLVGTLSFDFLWLQTVDARDLRLLIHTPQSNTGTVEKIEQLLACESERL
jgi:hypothetical protein